MHSVSLRAVGMWRNSFGPWAFDPGPSTPVMQNWAFGNFSPSMYMNGIVPPSPMYIAGLPKYLREPASSACSSHAASSGASQPELSSRPVNDTTAPYGGSFSSAALTATDAFWGSTRGGMRIDSVSVVDRASTMP